MDSQTHITGRDSYYFNPVCFSSKCCGEEISDKMSLGFKITTLVLPLFVALGVLALAGGITPLSVITAVTLSYSLNIFLKYLGLEDHSKHVIQSVVNGNSSHRAEYFLKNRKTINSYIHQGLFARCGHTKISIESNDEQISDDEQKLFDEQIPADERIKYIVIFFKNRKMEVNPFALEKYLDFARHLLIFERVLPKAIDDLPKYLLRKDCKELIENEVKKYVVSYGIRFVDDAKNEYVNGIVQNSLDKECFR